MGFDCEIEQTVQIQYSIARARAGRIGVTLAADPGLRHAVFECSAGLSVRHPVLLGPYGRARQTPMRESAGCAMLCLMTANDHERKTGGNPERLPLGELGVDDRGQDEVSEALEESVGLGEARPLTREEREAAARDRGPVETVYAPASERVPKPPLPGDEKLIDQGH